MKEWKLRPTPLVGHPSVLKGDWLLIGYLNTTLPLQVNVETLKRCKWGQETWETNGME